MSLARKVSHLGVDIGGTEEHFGCHVDRQQLHFSKVTYEGLECSVLDLAVQISQLTDFTWLQDGQRWNKIIHVLESCGLKRTHHDRTELV
jgi:hypothetical protein